MGGESVEIETSEEEKNVRSKNREASNAFFYFLPLLFSQMSIVSPAQCCQLLSLIIVSTQDTQTEI